ncbi:fatty acid--CoA ligase [Kitasatospora saccharophila]|uniref:Fatty acid--CoA ligase n=1 Tax=Kitasatospora saccharophila TaxID=407973 RepID=A0ABP5JVH2_9ACTN
MGLHLPDAVRLHAREHAGSPALTCEGRTIGYGELDSRTNRLARALLTAAPTGSRIGHLTRTRCESGEILVAAGKAGLVAVPLNWRLAVPELVAVARDAGLRVLIAEPEFLPGALAVRESLPGLLLVVIGEPYDSDTPAYEAWLSAHLDEDPGRGGGADRDEVALQLYTSGTTGAPKGVPLTHGNLRPDAEELDEYRWDADSVALNALPMFHIAGAGWLGVALVSGAHSLMVPDFAPDTTVETMESRGVTHCFLVPSVLHMLTELPDVDRRDFSRLRLIAYGGSPITPALLRRSMAVFGCGFMGKYGMTEAAGAVTQLPPHEHRAEGPGRLRLKSAGRPRGGVEVMIADTATGNPVPPGTVGEIRIRSRHNTAGYWNRPAETAALYAADGWLCTGDGGYLDEDGYLFLTDRIKDMIITGGENVYPAEVESALAEHPAVAEVAVVGVPHDIWGEAVTAAVVPRRGIGRPTEQELIAFARERIASYKKPRRVLFVDELPRNANGKVLRHELLLRISAN